ncbi:unnamed protein product [Didymodactylos carnosus]|uniref:Uncharacterized protein n=1 Tax=Didymodactylos carnosus TaxID=1234261 RepID=A0A8S2FK99_9BILA|nr:unnamed protein product [Didymodactylos carnosus]CAF4285147.1 unnamed protein product [Didymodactylos carnosus]
MLLGCNGTTSPTTQTATTLVENGITTKQNSTLQFASSAEASIQRSRRECRCPWGVRGCVPCPPWDRYCCIL